MKENIKKKISLAMFYFRVSYQLPQLPISVSLNQCQHEIYHERICAKKANMISINCTIRDNKYGI